MSLIDKLRQPNQREAWTHFVSLYAPLLLNWAARNGFQPADAEDLTQIILMKLLQQMPSYQVRPGGSFRAWLFSIARNEAANFRTRCGTRPLPSDRDLANAPVAVQSDFHEQEYRSALVHAAMKLIRSDFEPRTWAAFIGVRIDERPAADVARELGITPNAVYLACNRVMTRLRQELVGLLE